VETSDSTVRAVLSELVHGAMQRSPMRASPFTQSYLVAVLLEFVRSDPARLGLLLGVESVKAAALPPVLRYRRLKEIADTSLFLSGVFADYVETSSTGSAWYRTIGARAYLDLGGLRRRLVPAEPAVSAPADVFAETYNHLGRHFEEFASVLTTVADRELFPAHRRILALYQRWLETRSDRQRRRLINLGVSLGTSRSEGDDPSCPN